MCRTYTISLLALIALSGCGTIGPSEHQQQAADSRVEPTGVQPAVVQSLQRQVRDRDRRIAELTFQLEALKRIEQEAESRRQQGRFPAIRDR